MAAAIGAPAAAYLFSSRKGSAQEKWVDAGAVPELAPNKPEHIVVHRKRQDGWNHTEEDAAAWVVKAPNGNIMAFAPQCTHLGCAYGWDVNARHFVCPCHGSVFGVDGRVLAGPAPRPLDRYETRVEDGQLYLGPLRGESA